MGITVKYRVHEVAKDLNVKSADILALIASDDTSKNYMTALSIEELDFVFEHYTKKYGVATIMEYFGAFQEEIEAAKQKAADEEKARIAAEKAKADKEKAAAEKAAAEKAAQEKAAQEKAAAEKAAAEKAAAEKAAQEKEAKASESADRRKEQKKAPAKARTEFKTILKPSSDNPRPDGVSPIVVSTERQVKVVDTRKQVDVNLAKYDSRLDDMADQKMTKDFATKSKQKIRRKQQNTISKKEDEQAKLKRLAQYEKDKERHLSHVVLPESISVNELAAKLRTTNAEVVKKLMLLGIMASASQVIDYDTASLVAEELGAKVTKEVVVTIEDKLIDDTEDAAGNLVTRDPVVVVMGHVDHGKTSLLDAIRNTNVTAGEAGGITQHIGAYQVSIDGRNLTFLDTPGHAAFTSMRARGAQVTDIAILVVAADDGIMPQTVEAINHAKAAGVSIIVAINKMDKPAANPDKVKQALTEYELVPEEWGGDTICVPVSALKREGIDQLLEMVTLVADMKDLKANPDREAKGTVIEARLDKNKGPLASVLVQNGTLHSGDVIVAGTSVGRVRTMTNDKGRTIKIAGPSTPVEIVGLSEVPSAGDVFHVVKDERMARELVEQRKFKQKQEQFKANSNVSLDDLFAQIQDGSVKDLSIIIKADVQGSVEAVRASLEKLSNSEVRVKVIHAAAGGVTESDVMLATVSNAIIVGFNVRPDANAKKYAEDNHVEIRYYRVIYDCIEEIKAAMKGMLAPTYKEVSIGSAEVRTTFKVSGVGTIAGCYVKEGKITRSAGVRLVRDGIVVHEGKIDSLKRFKDDAREVLEGYECGVGLEKYNDIKEGDVIEAFIMEEVKN